MCKMNCLLGQLVSHYFCIFLTMFSGGKIGSQYFYLGLVGKCVYISEGKHRVSLVSIVPENHY